MTNINLTEAERTELIILVRMELIHLEELGKYNQEEYEKWRQCRIDIKHELSRKLEEEA